MDGKSHVRGVRVVGPTVSGSSGAGQVQTTSSTHLAARPRTRVSCGDVVRLPGATANATSAHMMIHMSVGLDVARGTPERGI